MMTETEHDFPGTHGTAEDTGAPAILPAESAEIARLEGELAETRDRMLRAMAETENVRRRLER